MSGGLWQRPTQTELLISKLRDARAVGKAIELPEIMRAGIAQHGARFNELRSRGFVIKNETERTRDGHVLSRYSLIFDPERDTALDLKPSQQALLQGLPESGDLIVQERHRDDG